MIRFSLKFDDENHSLTKEDGISFDKIGELLENLYSVIDNGTGSKCTLGQIRGNCYALDFYTNDIGLHNNFIIVHKNLEQVDVDDLTQDQKKYANTLRTILGGKYYLKAYDNNGVEIAAISEIGLKKLTSYYYSTDTVYGVLSELGSTSLNSNRKHIYLDGVGYRIFISKDQDIELKPHYGTDKLRVELRQKRSSVDGHIVNSELISFTNVSVGNLADNLSQLSEVDLEILKGVHTIDDILNRIYAIR